MNLPVLNRFQAAGIHLIISACVAVGLLILMLELWYPPPLFNAMGGQELILLLVGVDVTVGPLLTLVVYVHGKKSLRFDLATIATLQLGALAYGAHAMYLGRPVFIAFAEDAMAVVSAADVDEGSLAKARPEFRDLSKIGPVLVAADMPADVNERNDVLFAGLGGIGLQHLPQYYVPYRERSNEILAASRPLTDARNLTGSEHTTLAAAIKRSGKTSSDLRFLPVKTRRAILLALIDAKSGRLLEILAVDAVRAVRPSAGPSSLTSRPPTKEVA